MSPKKVPATITYASPGAQPPIYLAGSFSDWHPEEMEFTTNANNEHHFTKSVMAEEGGEFQYKFRIGDGDWWALNEAAPTATDDLGNRNNVLIVPVSAEKSTEPPSTEQPSTSVIQEPAEPSPTTLETTSGEKEKISHSPEHIEEKAGALSKPEDTQHTLIEPILAPVSSTDESTEIPHVEKTPPTLPPNDGANILTAPITEATRYVSSEFVAAIVEDNPGESSGSEAILTPQTSSTTEEKHEPMTTEEIAENPHEPIPTPPRAHTPIPEVTSEKVHDGQRKGEEYNDTPIPEVIVEKVDDELQHGDDFGENATTEQKKAFEMRAQDAEPDLVVVKPEASVESETAAEVADSAAELDKGHEGGSTVADVNEANQHVQTPDEIASEVADWAAIIDKEKPEPLSPDDEAGRTGERRLSYTPIPEVARTASEVADTAAIIDADNVNFETSRFKFVDPDSASASGTATPANEIAPLFAHECPEPYEADEGTTSVPVPEEPSEFNIDDEEALDSNDPYLEQFPSDRHSILHTVRSCETRLDADQTNFEGSPSSPLVGRNDVVADKDLGEPTSALLDSPPKPPARASPVLDIIKEEHTTPDDMAPLPSSSKAELEHVLVEKELPPGTTVAVQPVDDEPMTPSNEPLNNDSVEESLLGTKPFVTISATKHSEASQAEALEQEKVSDVVKENQEEVEVAREASLNSEESKEKAGAEKGSVGEIKPPAVTPYGINKETSASTTAAGAGAAALALGGAGAVAALSYAKDTEGKVAADTGIGRPIKVELTEPEASKPETRQLEVAIKPEVTPAEPVKPKVTSEEPVKPDVTPAESVKPDVTQSEASTDVPPIEKPVKQAASDEEPFIKDVKAAGNDGPTIAIQPATPGVVEATGNSLDTARSSAVENATNGDNVKMRNPPVTKRASTPTSLSSPAKEKGARNIFAAIWQTVFVSWIGGFITQLCGGRRRPLLAVTVVVLTLLYFRI